MQSGKTFFPPSSSIFTTEITKYIESTVPYVLSLSDFCKIMLHCLSSIKNRLYSIFCKYLFHLNYMKYLISVAWIWVEHCWLGCYLIKCVWQDCQNSFTKWHQVCLIYYLPWLAKNCCPKRSLLSVCQSATFKGQPAQPCRQSCLKMNLKENLFT